MTYLVFTLAIGAMYGWLLSQLLERRDGQLRLSHEPVGRVEFTATALIQLTGLLVLTLAVWDG